MTADLASGFRAAIERAGLEPARRLRAAGRAGVRRSRHVGEDRPQPALERVQVHVRRSDRGDAAACAASGSSWRSRDTGIGIPEHELPHLFERFHRVRGARARTHEGSGIGLALVHELVRLHGGTVSVSSRARPGHDVHGVDPARQRAPAGRARRRRARAGSRRRRARRAYVEEALRWLPDGERADWRGPRRRAANAAARRRSRPRASCWPTTTPTCATTSRRMLERPLAGRDGRRRAGGAGGGRAAARRT